MKLSIVIPVFNKWPFTKSCLKELVHLPPDHEIIIIDNASSDETNIEINKLGDEIWAQDPELKHAHFSYVRNEQNTFHSAACNQGYRLASGENILFLNNDIKVKGNPTRWTQPLLDGCATGAIVGPTMGVLDNDLNFVKEAKEQLSGNSYLGGWCIAASKDTWKKLDTGNGPWNESFPFYFNDTDLSFRARKAKIPLTVVSLPDALHYGKVSAAQINIHKLYTEGRSVFLKHWSKR